MPQPSLDQMKNTDVLTVDPATLADLRNVSVNIALPREERVLDYIGQIKNPYCFLCGKTVVKIGHADTEATLEDCLERYLLSL